MNQPKRNLKIWIPIAAVLCFWLGDWMGHTYELTEGTTTHRLTAALNLNSLLLHPFRLSADAFSLGCGIAAALMAGLIYLCVKYSKHRLMPQKEYGSARWGGPEDIAPFLNENPQNNLPLTASESLSLSPKMKVTANDNYNRNKNVIVFGPSGSGKSYSVAGPQLLQFNSNYVLSDPKGELLQEYGNVLLSQGYKVKVFNLKDRDKSDHYNLFAYIKNEDDILVVTKNLVKNLKEDPTAKSTADPIWEEGMTALLRGAALCVDATHPYAAEATRNIRAAAAAAGVEYHRLLRPASPLPAGSVVLADAARAAAYLADRPGRVLLATGAKELPAFAALDPARLYPRVLPTLAGIAACEAAGVPHRNILAMQGPFTRELNAALLHQFHIDYMVTKDGGAAGGFAEKAEAAARCGVQLIVLRRPDDAGETADTILQRCRELL